MALMLIGMSVLFIGGNYFIQTSVVMPAFASLEQQRAVRDATRCVAGLKRDLELLGDLTKDWGSWDDSYHFVQDQNAEFRESNLTPEAFESARISLLALLDANGKLVWGDCYDIENQEPIKVPGLWPVLEDARFPLTRHAHVDDSKGGLLLTVAGPLLLSASPIITSKREGPIRGSMIMGRFLGEAEIQELAKRAEVDLSAWSLAAPSAADREILEELRQGGGPLVRVGDAETLETFAVVDDIYGRPGLLLRVNVPREISAQGKFAAMLATWGGVLGGLGVMGGAWLLIRHRVVSPLEAMVSHARHVGDQSDLKARLNSLRGDEIGQLSRAFDEMVECLAASRQKVLEAAHRSGMADVASEVLHNVGNTINSAKASVEQLELQLRSGNLEGLEKAAELLRENSGRLVEFFGQDPRGPKLVGFLVKLAGVLREECVANQGSVTRIQNSLRHIQEIVALQEHRVKEAQFACETDLAERLREVVLLNQDRLDLAGIEVKVRAESLPELMLNRSKLTQVLVNLVRNAIQAMDRSSSGSRVLTMTAFRTEDRGVGIEVKDTGCGMSEDVKAKIFQNGFTTKAEGQGIGLHYCANAVRSMGGQIFASSDGPGQGSTIHIRFPESVAGAVQVPEAAKAA